MIIILILQEVYGIKKKRNNNADVTNDNNASSFQYKANTIGNTDVDGANRNKEIVKIAVPLRYLNNSCRSLEMPLINCKVEISLKWIENCILSHQELLQLL